MSCYTRHLGGVMAEVGLEDNKENRKRLDIILREFLGYALTDECPLVWKEIQRYLADPVLKMKMLEKIQRRMEVSE
ncbi:MAG: hypothetical protein WCP58_06505 [bacterium]